MTQQDPFITDFDPPVGVAEELAPGLRRVVAPNASAMTFRGTNSYLLGEAEIAVIDPGPHDPAHLAALRRAIGDLRRISHVIVTHSHADHSPLARPLAELADAPVLALGDSFSLRSPVMQRLAAQGDLGGGEGIDRDFRPDVTLIDGQHVETREWTLEVVATPGHFSNHVCLAWMEDAAVFTGDHVMSWATTLVSPPDGDLAAFMRSLERLRARIPHDRRYYPGHGDVLENVAAMIDWQIAHRRERESQIIEALDHGPATARGIARAVYAQLDPALLPFAARNVLAHLVDLVERKVVGHDGELAAESRFFLRRNTGFR